MTGTAATNILPFLLKSIFAFIQIRAPAIVIKPKTTIEAPVKMATGIVLIRVPNLGDKPNRMAKTPAMTKTTVE